MPRAAIVSALIAAVIGVGALARPTCAQTGSAPETVGDLTVPGGLRSAARVVNDTRPANASFLLDVIRRSYDAPTFDAPAPGGPALQGLLAHVERSSRGHAHAPSNEESARAIAGDDVDGHALPLPLPARVWTDVVFSGHATTETLLAGILRSRNAALLYYGLFSLDDETRAWLATEPGLIRDLVERYPAAFTVAAPALRVAGGRVRPPGDERAVPAWEALVGRPATDPGAFLRALLSRDGGHLAYFFGAMAPLSAQQLQFGLHLDAGPDHRVEDARRWYRAFEPIVERWNVEDHPFWRPTLDPAMLLADLDLDERGEPVVPGTASFWNAVLDGTEPAPTSPVPEAVRRMADGAPVEFPWLCEELVRRGIHGYRGNHLTVLFASRVVKQVTPETVGEAADAVRAARAYPALTTTLERAGVDQVAIFARAARQAAQLSRIGHDTRAARSIAQFQGAIFLVARAAVRGGWPAGLINDAVSSLVSVEPSPAGDYEGRLVQWIAAFVDARQASSPGRPAADGSGLDTLSVGRGTRDSPSFELDVLRLVAGEGSDDPPVVDWEGTRYRVDFAWAEARRVARLLGEHPLPYLATAKALVEIAESVSLPDLARETLRQQAAAVEAMLQAAPWGGEVRDALERAARMTHPRQAFRLADTLRLLADDLLARGLSELAYAVALGDPDRAAAPAGEVAGRHDFGPSRARATAWQAPTARTDVLHGWHVGGALLGLDVTLVDRALVSVSSTGPRRAPAVDPIERRGLAEAVALVEPAAISDADMRAIVTAIRNGHERVARVRSRADAVAIADEIRLGPARRTLLSWTAARRPEWLRAFLAPVEVFWLGLEGAAPGTTLHAWGAPVGARTGCACLRLDAPRPLDALAGRRYAAILASGFPDLNLRLAELLSELHMPAALLAPVLAAATLDLVTNAVVRDRDDRRGLETFVWALRRDAVEQYLALLTTGGPLVPIETPAPADGLAPSPGGRR